MTQTVHMQKKKKKKKIKKKNQQAKTHKTQVWPRKLKDPNVLETFQAMIGGRFAPLTIMSNEDT